MARQKVYKQGRVDKLQFIQTCRSIQTESLQHYLKWWSETVRVILLRLSIYLIMYPYAGSNVCSQALNYQPNTAGNFKVLRLGVAKPCVILRKHFNAPLQPYDLGNILIQCGTLLSFVKKTYKGSLWFEAGSCFFGGMNILWSWRLFEPRPCSERFMSDQELPQAFAAFVTSVKILHKFVP